MRIFGFQTDIAWEDRSANFSRIEAMEQACGPIEANSLVVFPELATSGFTMNIAAVAEPRDGESAQFFSGFAKKHHSNVIAGVAATGDEPGLAANEAACFSPEGNEVARYRKMNPFIVAGEGNYYPAGKSPVVYQIGDWKVAPLICYDLRFPEPFRTATSMGAELIVVIANWPAIRVDHWTTLLRARAIENQACVVGVNRAGNDPMHEYPGASIILGPQGEILAAADDSATVISAVLDREKLLKWRRDFPAIAGLKPAS
jgi:omega-amidase